LGDLKLAEPASLEITHVRGAVLLLGEEADIVFGEMNRQLFTVLGQDGDALTQLLDFALVFYCKAHSLFDFSLLYVLGSQKVGNFSYWQN